jgi:hypothetical protein
MGGIMKHAFLMIGMILFTVSAQAVTWSDFLRGVWLTHCDRSSNGRYVQTSYNFSDFTGPEFALVLQGSGEYYDSKCTKTYSYAQNRGQLNLRSLVSLQVPNETPQKGAKIRWQINPLFQYPYAFYDKKAVESLNQKAYCGKTDWEVGKAKDLLETTCGPEVRDYYAKNWFFLEVRDIQNLRIGDQAGNHDDLHRWAFPAP